MPSETDATLDDLNLTPGRSSLPADASLPLLAMEPGRRFGDYEIVKELGRGGMGVVYLARQVSLNRMVALKMILAGALASEDAVQRFQTEARAAAALTHPGIVPIYEVGQFGACHFFSMGHVSGGSLADRVAAGPTSPDEATALVKAVADAIEVAHQHGIIHRDLKPANILLDAEGRPLVTDFGLAKQVSAEVGLPGSTQPHGVTQSGAVMGTPSYMAPEQAAGRVTEIGVRSDVYALGAILYELLAGRPPFRAATTFDTLLQVLDSPPAPPRVLNSSIPADLEAICLKCLEKAPSDRYASAKELADDLGRYLEREPVRADTSRATRLFRPWLRDSRHKEILALHALAWRWQAVLVFVVLLLTNILSWAECTSIVPYAVLWTSALFLWGVPAWYYLYRTGREWSPTEKQLGQVTWMSLSASALIMAVGAVTGMSHVQIVSIWIVQLALSVGCMAVILRGSLYLLAALCALSAVVVALLPSFGPVIFGTAFAVGLFVPAWKHTRPGGSPSRHPVPHTDRASLETTDT